jgi:hypothetical protein
MKAGNGAAEPNLGRSGSFHAEILLRGATRYYAVLGITAW